ncbi:MAG: hypothetical protein RJB57_1093, partial [Actinomycetota bacterium]
TEVRNLRDYDVQWRFISLKFLNEEKMDYSKMPEGYADIHMSGTRGLRVAARARAEQGNDAVATTSGMAELKRSLRERPSFD